MPILLSGNATAINVGVVDDSFFMGSITKKMLESDPGIKVIFEASNGSEAVHKTRNEKPDVLVMDLQMPLMVGFTSLTQIMKDSQTPMVILTLNAKRVLPASQAGEFSPFVRG
ncbi:MAG: response regulator [Candidatus Micrarchaeota archaeon]